MGVVYLAYDPELDRRVALKMLRPDTGWGEDEVARAPACLREAQAMAKLSHPNVLPVYDVGEVADRIYLAVEYVEGRTLKTWLRDRKAWREIVMVFVQAGRGLAAAHRVDLVHRDFKPSNVLVGDDGRVRVFDFGLARSSEAPETTRPEAPSTLRTGETGLGDPITQVGTVLGTPAYMSPEQRAGSQAGTRSDQFSFCVALYEALFGKRPFSDEALQSGKLPPAAEPPATARVPPRIRRAVMRGLSLNPDARFRVDERAAPTARCRSSCAPSLARRRDRRRRSHFLRSHREVSETSVRNPPLDSRAYGTKRENSRSNAPSRQRGRATLPIPGIPSRVR